MQNYYKLLDISPTASAEEIKEAIKKLNKVWYTRTNSPSLERRQHAERMVKALEEAEKILLDPQKKAEYEKELNSAAPEPQGIDETEIEPTSDLVAEAWRLLQVDRVADAIYVGTKATEKDGSNPEAWAVLAQAKFLWGDVDDAIYEYNRAIKLKPNDDTYYFDLGTIYQQREQWREAVNNYERASKIAPQVSMYRAAIGEVFARLEKYDTAIQILEQCHNEEPDNESYKWILAYCYLDSCYRSWKRDPENGDYMPTETKDIQDAYDLIKKAQDLKSTDPEISNMLADTIKRIGELTKRNSLGDPLQQVCGS